MLVGPYGSPICFPARPQPGPRPAGLHTITSNSVSICDPQVARGRSLSVSDFRWHPASTHACRLRMALPHAPQPPHPTPRPTPALPHPLYRPETWSAVGHQSRVTSGRMLSPTGDALPRGRSAPEDVLPCECSPQHMLSTKDALPQGCPSPRMASPEDALPRMVSPKETPLTRVLSPEGGLHPRTPSPEHALP